jgi:PHD/YefM family antitoxin component YafN of YafNO toxin-antitoxin module
MRLIMITRQGRDHLVVLAAEEYESLKRYYRRVYRAGELPEEWLEAVKNARMDSQNDYLNALPEDNV